MTKIFFGILMALVLFGELFFWFLAGMDSGSNRISLKQKAGLYAVLLIVSGVVYFVLLDNRGA
ncbi:hypothetical protein [Ectobacillus panaciterrae]|uniref:hypothetical protein n=1 Tax=Ectobacillus panaciterrae TaxID=363872 RepID=UPI0004165DC1|nr:hypothetical protein [Ectobacillus panaciterrae]